LIENAQSYKGVLTVLITSLTKKIETPHQDVRYHKVELPNGYSGRSDDFKYVTPFIRAHFPALAMAESGWLTRSLEQVHPFTLDFPGKIRDKAVKQAFLAILDDIETKQANPEAYLVNLLAGLLEAGLGQRIIEFSNSNSILSIDQVMTWLDNHFQYPYGVTGAARLPVLAIYAAYEVLMPTRGRYRDKRLLPLKSHTTADSKSGSIGDVEIVYRATGDFFEAVEVKHNKPIDPEMVRIAIGKINALAVKRYYLLTTAEPNRLESDEIEKLIAHTRESYGCEVIVNGMMPTLRYYLRLVENPQGFIQCYEKHLMADYDLKQVHLEQWQTIKVGK
jgi:DNA (cytosine-5)-methyltransferase 1